MYITELTVSPQYQVPEPSSFYLLVIALCGFLLRKVAKSAAQLKIYITILSVGFESAKNDIDNKGVTLGRSTVFSSRLDVLPIDG